MKNKRVYIHYGDTQFRPEKFSEIKNCRYPWVKPMPKTGMWASPLQAKWGWKQWCISENFYVDDLNESFQFVLSDNARVCHIYSVDDLQCLPMDSRHNLVNGLYLIDFEESKFYYDAIELHLSEEQHRESDKLGLYYLLYGWDCDSILILNSDVIKEI